MSAPLFNRARGEAALDIDGAPHRLCLTLGALAELEAAFDVEGFAALGERFAAMSASDMLTVLAALSAGGGAPKTSAELAAAAIDPRAAAAAIAAAFRRAFEDEA
jgi:hypothetical protein